MFPSNTFSTIPYYFYIDIKKTGHFYSGDFSLGFSKGINTYLAAEIYDTEDKKTKNELFQLSAGGKFIESCRMNPPSNKDTRKVSKPVSKNHKINLQSLKMKSKNNFELGLPFFVKIIV